MSTPALDLSQFDDAFRQSTVEQKPRGVPDGRYRVTVEHVDLGETRSTGRPMLKWTLKITGPEYAGRLMWKNMVISDRTVSMVKEDLELCGLRLDSLNELPAHLGNLLDIPLEVTKKTNGEYENVYFNKRLDGGPSVEDDEDLPF